LLVARRLVDEGVTLGAVKKFNLGKSTEELEQALLKPSKEEAISVSEQYREAVLEAKEAKQVAVPLSVQADVIGEVKQIRESISKELKEIEFTKHQIQDMLNKLEDRQQELYKRLEYEREELRNITMSAVERMAQMVERRGWELEAQFQVFSKEMASIQEQMMTVLKQQNEQRLLSK
jgi:arginyl-tRNA synthetase